MDFPLVLEENGVKLRLNIIDTPGYGDQINNENWYALQEQSRAFKQVLTRWLCASWEPILRYIKDQHSSHLRKELTTVREGVIADTRVHAASTSFHRRVTGRVESSMLRFCLSLVF